MIFDGAPVTAQRVHELGGLNRVVPEGQALPVALAWAERLAGRPARSLVALKKILNDAAELPLSEALANEQKLFQSLALSPEGVASMAEARRQSMRGGPCARSSESRAAQDPLGDDVLLDVRRAAADHGRRARRAPLLPAARRPPRPRSPVSM